MALTIVVCAAAIVVSIVSIWITAKIVADREIKKFKERIRHNGKK